MNKSQKFSKRGISPLIATVLIIGFTIVLAALVITWGTKLFQGTVEDTESAAKINLLCTSISYDASVSSSGVSDLKVKVNNNKADPLSGVYFVVKSSTYSTNNKVLSGTGVVNLGNLNCNTLTSPPNCGVGAFEEKEFTLVGAQPVGTEVDVRAIVDVDGEKTVCENERHVKI